MYILRPQYGFFLKMGFGINLWFLSHLSLFWMWHINWFFCNIISRKTYNQMYMETWAFWQNLIYSLLFLLLTLFLTTCNIPFCIIESKSRHPACFVWMDWTSIVKWEKVEKAHKVTPWKRKTSLRKLHLCMVL